MTDWASVSALDWDCKNGEDCFNVNGRPKLLALYDALSDRKAFSDIDGTTEIAGHFLFLEFKAPGVLMKRGQELYHERLTALSPKIQSIIVSGNCAAMEVKNIRIFRNGKGGDWQPCDFAALFERVKKWAEAAEKSKAKRETKNATAPENGRRPAHSGDAGTPSAKAHTEGRGGRPDSP